MIQMALFTKQKQTHGHRKQTGFQRGNGGGGFSIVLKGHRIFKLSIGFSLKSTAALAPNERVSLCSEVLKPGIDFCPAMKVLDSIFFQ